MNEIFFTVLAWFGLFIAGGMTFAIWSRWYSLNHTSLGKLEQTLAKCQGHKIVPRNPVPYIIIFIVSAAWLLSQGF